MNHEWLISEEPCPEHQAWAQFGNYFFASQEWAALMISLGATPLYAWSRQQQAGTLIPVFRRKSLRIGFLGFPVAGDVLDNLRPSAKRALINAALKAGHLNLIRVTHAHQLDFPSAADSARPDVWIDDLATWRTSARLRRDLSYARRASSQLKVVNGLTDPDSSFALYAEVISNHRGSPKYTAAYFRALATLASTSAVINACSAVDPAGTLQAFAVMARHGNWGYYLHSATGNDAKRTGINDLLLDKLVSEAREAGCTRCSFMASPWQQPGLIRFKQKWGDRTGLAVTTDFGSGLQGLGLHAITRWQGRHDRQAARNWTPEK